MSHEKIASTFDAWAADGRADGLEDGHGDVVRQVIEQMGIRAGQQVLDLGCGSGWATRLLARAAPGAGAVGVDLSPRMVARAEELHDLTSRARYQQGAFEALELPDRRFDRVFSMEALYYAVDLERALAEMLRVLRPGGTADVVLDHYRESTHTAPWGEMVGVSTHYLGEEEWRAAFEAAGFTGVTTRRVIDRRGPGEESRFRPSRHCPDWKTAVELHAAGSLWIHAVKPS